MAHNLNNEGEAWALLQEIEADYPRSAYQELLGFYSTKAKAVAAMDNRRGWVVEKWTIDAPPYQGYVDRTIILTPLWYRTLPSHHKATIDNWLTVLAMTPGDVARVEVTALEATIITYKKDEDGTVVIVEGLFVEESTTATMPPEVRHILPSTNLGSIAEGHHTPTSTTELNCQVG